MKNGWHYDKSVHTTQDIHDNQCYIFVVDKL